MDLWHIDIVQEGCAEDYTEGRGQGDRQDSDYRQGEGVVQCYSQEFLEAWI